MTIDGNLEIESWAFAHCENVLTISFPKNLKIITPHSFQGCKMLKKIQLPENLKKIQTYAFLGCDMLEQVTIPSQLTHLSPLAFKDCPKVTFQVEDIDKTYITHSAENRKNIIEIALEAQLHWAVTDLIFRHKDSLKSVFLEENKLPILASVLKSVFEEISDSQDDEKIQVATDALNVLLPEGSFINICDQNSAVCQEIFNLLIKIGNEDLLTRILQKQPELKPFENSDNSTVQSVLKKIKQNDLKRLNQSPLNPLSDSERVNHRISNTTASFFCHAELAKLGMLNRTSDAQSAWQNPEHTAIPFSKQIHDSNQSPEKKTKTSQDSANNQSSSL